MNRVAENAVRFACLIGRLPDIRTVVVLQLADLRDSLVVHDERGRLAVGTLQRMDEGDEVITLECGSKRFCHMTTAGFRKQAKRLTDTGAVEECVLLCIGKCLAELGENVILQLERIVVEQFLGHLDSDIELVRIQKDLCKGCVTERECAAFLDPRSGRRSRCNVDLVLTGCGDDMTELSHDVFLGKRLNEAGIILFGYEVAAVSVNTLAKDIAHLVEVAAKGGEHSGAVGIGSTTGLGLLISGGLAVHGLLGDGRGSGSVQLRFHCGHGFHALDLGAIVLHLLFQLSIGLGILFGKKAVLVALGFHKSLCGIPSLVALFTQFIDRHINYLQFLMRLSRSIRSSAFCVRLDFGVMVHFAAIFSMREFTTFALEYSMETAGVGTSSDSRLLCMISSAKPSSTALVASIHVSASIR